MSLLFVIICIRRASASIGKFTKVCVRGRSKNLVSNQSINQYSFNKSCQTQLKTAKILAMHTQ